MPRILVVITPSGGDVDVVNVGRPAALVAFGDKFGKTAPDTYAELAWIAHRAIVGHNGGGPKLDAWLETLDDLTASPDALEAAQRKLRDEMTPVERLEAMPAAELCELAVVDDGRQLAELIREARSELVEREERAREQADAVAARDRLEGLTAAELQSIDADELAELRELAAKAPEVAPAVPTTPTPATRGGGG